MACPCTLCPDPVSWTAPAPMAMPPAEQQPTHTRLPGQEGYQPLAMVGASTPCSAPASWATPAALSQHRHPFSAGLQVTAALLTSGVRACRDSRPGPWKRMAWQFEIVTHSSVEWWHIALATTPCQSNRIVMPAAEPASSRWESFCLLYAVGQ